MVLIDGTSVNCYAGCTVKLSIIIPSKNEQENLPSLLETIRGQSFEDYEIIVADAHSTDKTRTIAESFGARVIDGAMPGPGRNRGAAVAKGDIFVFFDADAELGHKDFLRDCVEEMEERALDVATCRLKANADKALDHALHDIYNAFTVATERILPHAPGSCIFARREAHVALNGFDEEVVFAEDHDYARRAKKIGFKFGIMRRQKITVSVRRLEEDGRVSIAIKYVFGELHMITRGSMKKEYFKYKMGGEAKIKKEPIA